MSDKPENTTDRNQERPLMVKRQFFRRRKSCPFTGPKAMVIDYKDIRTLSKFVSELEFISVRE